MTDYLDTGLPGPEELLFLPLGGCGEIGMNLNLYGHDGQWLMVDCGISFADSWLPGVDIIMPDPGFIVEQRENLIGLFLTHAHEDHLGAIPYLWPQLRCPIYATPFTAAFLRKKLQETDFADDVPIHVVPLSGAVTVGPFNVEFVTLTHSILEPNALLIKTAAGDIMHTGDWKIDPDPVIGAPTDAKRLTQAGDQGILAMVCDSTNAMVPGHSRSEGVVQEGLKKAFAARAGKGRIAVGCFASNVARLESICRAAQAVGRHVALVGRSLWRITEAAKETGYLADLPPFLDDQAIMDLAPEKTVLICTGSQGEPRAALSRIARDDHPFVKLAEGDCVLFSSREIPGNELAIGRLQNQLASLGVDIVTSQDIGDIHASGHPNRDELAAMYGMVKPAIAIPVHGERRHLLAHAKLAKECQISHAPVIANGDCLRLDQAGAHTIDQVHSGRLVLDGKMLRPADALTIRDRRKISQTGHVTLALALNKKGNLADEAQLSLRGIIDEDDPFWDDLLDFAEDHVEALKPADRQDDKRLIDGLKPALRKRIHAETGHKPVVDILIMRV